MFRSRNDSAVSLVVNCCFRETVQLCTVHSKLSSLVSEVLFSECIVELCWGSPQCCCRELRKGFHTVGKAAVNLGLDLVPNIQPLSTCLFGIFYYKRAKPGAGKMVLSNIDVSLFLVWHFNFLVQSNPLYESWYSSSLLNFCLWKKNCIKLYTILWLESDGWYKEWIISASTNVNKVLKKAWRNQRELVEILSVSLFCPTCFLCSNSESGAGSPRL